jgi:NADPH-dependent 2,4-dienoyl-CoA reductase/sulfur reductase-like enzyme
LLAVANIDHTQGTMAGKQKIVVVGAGPVGSLAALYAAQRGHDVEVYELRNGQSPDSASHKRGMGGIRD